MDDTARVARPGFDSAALPSRASPSQAKALLDPATWNEYLKVAFVRNPWDLLVAAYLSDEDDLRHVRDCIEQLDDSLWQHRGVAASLGGALWKDDEGWWRTRVVDGACIFQNRPDHLGGPGCAFHHLAMATGRPHLEVKPEICWQAPLRREDHETVTGHIYTMVREWHRRDWGGEETDVWWWCTDDELAHVGHRPVYLEMAAELSAICGPEIYGWIKAELDERLDPEPARIFSPRV